MDPPHSQIRAPIARAGSIRGGGYGTRGCIDEGGRRQGKRRRTVPAGGGWRRHGRKARLFSPGRRCQRAGSRVEPRHSLYGVKPGSCDRRKRSAKQRTRCQGKVIFSASLVGRVPNSYDASIALPARSTVKVTAGAGLKEFCCLLGRQARMFSARGSRRVPKSDRQIRAPRLGQIEN